MFEDRLEFDVGVELYGERTDIASGHHISRIGGCFILVYEFRTGDAALRTGLVQEVHHGAAQRQFLVHLPVDAAEGFPSAVEVISIVDVGIRLAEVTEAGPDLQIIRNHIARVDFHNDLRNLGYNVSGSIDFAHITVGEGDGSLILLVGRLLVSEQEVQVKSLARMRYHVGGPSDGLDVEGKRSGHNLVLSVSRFVLQVQRGVVVGLGDVRH